MVITLTGENSFAVAMAERQLANAFTAKHGPHSVERLEAENLGAGALPDLLQGATLFASARMVVIKGLAANKALLEPLTLALQQAASSTTVVIADAALDKRTKLFKFLKAGSTFKEFPLLTEAQLATWAQTEATRLGSQVTVKNAVFLVQQVGNDQWRLAGELEKLALQPSITRQAIEQLVEPTPEASVFGLLDAALAGRPAQVGEMLGAIKAHEDPYKLFGLLASQVYTLAVVASAGSRSDDTVAREAGLHPFVVRKSRPVAGRLGPVGVRQLVARVARCDMQLKSTGADPWLLLQLCLQK